MWTVSRARRAAGDHRRRRARHRPRARRGDHALDGLGLEGLRAQPARRPDFIFEPLRTLAATIVEDAESLNAPAVQASRLRVRAAAAVLEPRAVARRLGRQAADEEVRDPRLMAVAPPTLEPLPARRRPPRKRRVKRVAARPGAGATASPSRCAGRRASRCALIAGGDRRLHGVSRACSTCSLDAARQRTRSRRLDQSKTGGFLDPILGTVLLTSSASRSPRRSPSATAIWIVEYGRPGVAGARRRVGHRDRRRHARHRASRSSASALFQQGIFGWLSFTAAGRRGVRPLVPDRRGDDVADRAADGLRRRRARGCRRSPRTCARRPTALGKTRIATIRRVLLPSVRPNISTGAALGMGRIAGDTAIVVILLGATLRLEPEGVDPGRQTAARAPARR